MAPDSLRRSHGSTGRLWGLARDPTASVTATVSRTPSSSRRSSAGPSRHRSVMAALRADRVTHAACLFSGLPAAAVGKEDVGAHPGLLLNCARPPPPTRPAALRPSCWDHTGASRQPDVVEIDAASHNGVDDACDLRERAAFAPAPATATRHLHPDAEAHTRSPRRVSTRCCSPRRGAACAHVKFIFATTEPEKVSSAPSARALTTTLLFRLSSCPGRPRGVPGAYLCRAEGVGRSAPASSPRGAKPAAAPCATPLSVMDQLIGCTTVASTSSAGLSPPPLATPTPPCSTSASTPSRGGTTAAPVSSAGGRSGQVFLRARSPSLRRGPTCWLGCATFLLVIALAFASGQARPAYKALGPCLPR